MRKIKVFYAWQSDTVQRFNRHLIRMALDAAAKRISADAALQVEVEIDCDTEGVPGQPPVTETILKKISGCDVFIPDVTFVARTNAGKHIPNPNVMVEYGYAIKARTYAALMPIMNVAYGQPAELPFDMGHLRHPIQYNLGPNSTTSERRTTRSILSAEFEQKLRLQIAATAPPAPPPRPFVEAPAQDGLARFRAPGTPIGRRWDSAPFGQIQGQDVTLAAGPTMWLRLMPVKDPGRRWSTAQLKEQAIKGGNFNLEPFQNHPVHYLRAEDGMAVCYLLGVDAPETGSLAFAFETGEIWSADITLLHYSPGEIPFIEIEYVKRFGSYLRFLGHLGLVPPYRWIAGLTGVKDRRLQTPLPNGHFRIVGYLGPECLSETISKEGLYSGNESIGATLRPFFQEIFHKCGETRPDYLP
jgi:hypothetical protein